MAKPDRWEFEKQNSDLPLETDNGVNIVFLEYGGQIDMFLRIDSGTKQTCIRKDWHVIAKWRRRLDSYQGFPKREADTSELLRHALHKAKEAGASYQDIANGLNEELVRALTDASASSWDKVLKPFLMLKDLGFSDEDSRTWVADAIDNLEKGRPLFRPATPVDREKVRELIRHHRVKWPLSDDSESS